MVGLTTGFLLFRKLISGVLKYWPYILLALFAASILFFVYRYNTLIEESQEQKVEIARLNGMVRQWQASYHQSELLRATENEMAVEDHRAYQIQCERDIAEAQRSAQAIRTIVTREVEYDESRCPVRTLVPSDSLRDAIGGRAN